MARQSASGASGVGGRRVRGLGGGGSRRVGRGFTLIELLVVILIIITVVAIVLPALGGARNAARNASTRALMSNVITASTQFQQDQRRWPGYFTVRDMGNAANEMRGMTYLESAMLELSGGIVDAAVPMLTLDNVGPTTADTVIVNPELIGAAGPGAKNYFSPPGKSFVRQNGADGGLQAGEPDHQNLPDLVDSFGSPLLIWPEDEGAVGTIRDLDDFVQMDSAMPARFYAAGNWGFLNSTALGKLGRSQIDVNDGKGYSLIGGGVASDMVRAEALAAVLGNPSYPEQDGTAPERMWPTAARGELMVHSAGTDGIYFGSRDTGARQVVGGILTYEGNFPATGEPEDVIKGFDDLLISGGN